MGTITQFPRAANAVRGGRRSSINFVAALVVGSLCTFPAVSAWAGMSEDSLKRQNIFTTIESQPDRNLVPSPLQADGTLRPVIPVSMNDPLGVDPPVRNVLLNQNSSIWRLPDPVAASVINATPKAEATPPLLIPLPTAISTGAIGLAALGMFGVAKRLRQRLFA